MATVVVAVVGSQAEYVAYYYYSIVSYSYYFWTVASQGQDTHLSFWGGRSISPRPPHDQSNFFT